MEEVWWLISRVAGWPLVGVVLILFFIAAVLVSVGTGRGLREALHLLTSETLLSKFWYATLGLVLLAFIVLAVINNL